MMATTHAAAGVLCALTTFHLFPDHATFAIVAGYAGGLFPDFDLFLGHHRKTLHFPTYYWAPTLVLAVVSGVTTHPLAVAGTFFFLAAAIHSGSDILGAGVEARPWNRDNPHAVYLHAKDKWLSARYIVPYDGSSHDFALCTLMFLPAIILLSESPLRFLVYASIAVSLVYVLLRKILPDIEDWLIEHNLYPSRRY